MYQRSGWDAQQFSQFSQHDFERYYPNEFQDRFDGILKLIDKRARQQAKKEPLDDVMQWHSYDPDRSREGFKVSAGEVVDILGRISEELR